MTATETEPVDGSLLRIDDAISELLDADLSRLTEDQLLDVVRAADRVTRRLAAVDHRVLGEVIGRGIAESRGYRDIGSLLAQLTASTLSQARARTAAVAMLGTRRAVSGAVLPPLLPVAADAARTGSVSIAHTKVIADVVRLVPESDQPTYRDLIDAELTGYAAAGSDSVTLKHLGTRILAHLHPDGDQPRDRQADRHRSISLRELPDGCGELRGRLTPTCLAVWQSVLHPLMSIPAPTTFESEPAVVEPGSDPIPDDRSIDQRRHDAFEHADMTPSNTPPNAC